MVDGFDWRRTVAHRILAEGRTDNKAMGPRAQGRRHVAAGLHGGEGGRRDLLQGAPGGRGMRRPWRSAPWCGAVQGRGALWPRAGGTDSREGCREMRCKGTREQGAQGLRSSIRRTQKHARLGF